MFKGDIASNIQTDNHTAAASIKLYKCTLSGRGCVCCCRITENTRHTVTLTSGNGMIHARSRTSCGDVTPVCSDII